MQLLRRDADLGAEPELAPVGEAGAGVDHHDGRVDLCCEAAGRRTVVGDDGLGVPGAEPSDAGQGLIEVVDHGSGMPAIKLM